ncbi:uncharacterized protein LOC127726694 [Mytilus californianus]|uniref:uncharacterized protein LOC127726694 n=1 Tax=Mytilus californianus TaxID=6549 RepID=UPI002247A018|nr:uncharacterized protein LOC127726694 [Mytilus californianus]XP_052090105.1 uncharacterized protein LOC127726694 [Mytilus californianus]XP_052090106.1 uncharacterized protein LOC127726694 [Mytilus californianus]
MTHNIITQEEDNYIRLDLLITGVSQRAARLFFDKEFDPVFLSKSINKERNKLTDLKAKRIINQKQWNLLYPRKGDPDSKTFDINLITTLLRNLTDLPPPKRGYDQLPFDEEDSPVSDLARLKHYRNDLAHITDKKIENDKFTKAWTDISWAIKRLGTADMAKECENLRVKDLNQSAVPYQGCSNIEEWHLTENPINTETNLKKLEDSMRTKKCVILKGLIGTGKSELALRYCYNAKKLDPTGIVHKLKCTDESMFERSLRELCKYFHDVEVRKEEQSQTDIVIDLIAKELRKRANYHHILLLDDINKIAKHTVSKFIKTCKRAENVKIIATTSLSLDIDKECEVLEIKGFSEDEAVEFLSYGEECQENVRKHYKELAKKFSYNPKGLQIARTYMEQTKLPVKDLVKQLNCPSDLLQFEESMAVKEQITDETLFHSLVSLIDNMHEKYKREGKEHIFEMLLSLQFLEVETIPVVLFEKFDSDVSLLSINDLLYEIRNSSFGTIYIEKRNSSEEVAEERQINTHDVVRLALQIYMTDKQGIIHTSNEKILRKLLRALFMLMDKDNHNPSDLHRHTLLLPHACAVIKHLKKMKISEKDKENLSPTQDLLYNQLENDVHIVYVKDIIGYTFSFSEMYYEASSYFDEAKSDLLELLRVNDKKFHNDLLRLTKLTSDPYELKTLVEEKSRELFHATEEFIREHTLALQTISKDYVLDKYRNRDDVEILKGVLGNHIELEKTTHLVEREFNELCMKGYAVPEERLGNEFMLSLLVSVCHTFGRRLFYQPDDIDWSLGKIFFSYLAIARNLSYMTNLKDNHLPNKESTKQCEKNENMQFNRLSSCLTERSEMQSVLNFFGRKENPVKAVILKDIISTCKKRFNEKTDYVEFGVLKVLGAKNDHAKYLSAKMIINCYKVLFQIEQTEEIRLEATQWGQNITKMIANNQSNFPSLEYSIGDLYFAIGDILEAEKCFRALLPKIDDNNKDDINNVKFFPRRACISYIKCRLERSEREDGSFKAETVRQLECFKTLLQTYKAEFNELEELELTLRKVEVRPDG